MIADRFNVPILIVHHTRKAPRNGGGVGDFVDAVLGSTGLTGAADTILVFSRPRGQPNAELHVTGRRIRQEQSYGLVPDAASVGWKLAGEADKSHLTPLQREIVQTVRDAARFMSPSEVAERLRIDGNKVTNALWNLSRRHPDVLVSRGDGTYGLMIGHEYYGANIIREQTVA